jgi:hypothetical protein
MNGTSRVGYKFNAKEFVYSVSEHSVLIISFYKDDSPVFKLSGPAADYFKTVFVNKCTSQAAIADILENYDINEATVRRDMDDLVAALAESQIVVK